MKAMSLQHEVESARTELDAVMREKVCLLGSRFLQHFIAAENHKKKGIAYYDSDLRFNVFQAFSELSSKQLYT